MSYILPKFTNEIPKGEGRRKIQQYYAEKAEQEIANANSFRDQIFLTDYTEVFFQKHEHHGSDYGLEFMGDYLSVKKLSYGYYGGAHGMYYMSAVVFDMRTGELLDNEDILKTDEEADKLAAECIMRYSNTEENEISEYEVEHKGIQISKSNIYLSKDGVVFVFSPYEYGSFGSGVREIVVPYEELEDILLLDIV